MAIAILATGDELIHGDTLNTNAHAIAHILCSEGLPIGLHLTCGDKEKMIVECLQFLVKQHDIIILLGGLGPTTDDVTRFALAQYTGDSLTQHQPALEHVEARLQRIGVPINQGNLQQCLFPATATPLPNPNGSAMGCYYPWKNKLFFLLPGPPNECLPMFLQQVLPLLQKTAHSTKQIIKWRIFGAAESEIGQILEEALEPFHCETGYRLETPYIEFKVRCTPDLVESIKKTVDPLLAPYVITSPDKKASEKLVELIQTINQPITIIDEVTGGLLESLLVKPGVHHLIHFNTLKPTALFFHLCGLNEYWSKQAPTGKTQLTIHYQNQQQKGDETHDIPYRSPMVIHYAAEWLSFRLFHLIDQLH